MAAISRMVLSWNDFELNAQNTFKDIWNDQDFADVTLASVDDQQIRVHKVILSSCSSFFQNILVKNPHQNPLIYLKGINMKNLELLMKFIYLGQCEVGQGELDLFLAAGKDLKVKGLMEEVSVMPELEQLVAKQKEERSPSFDTEGKEGIYIKVKHEVDETFNQDMGREFDDNCDIIKRNTYEIEENVITNRQCKKTCLASDSVGRKPIENSAMEVLKSKSDEISSCDQCEFKTKKKHLNHHKRSTHGGIQYFCSECDFKTSQQGNLTFHKRAKHEGIRFKCDYCGHLSTQKGSLDRHINAKHSGEERQIYSCDQCDFKVFLKSTLEKHTRSIHGGEWITCSMCDFRSTVESTVTKHQESKHNLTPETAA